MNSPFSKNAIILFHSTS